MPEISELAGPHDLQTVLDYRLDESGVERGAFIGAELLAPTHSRLRVEDQTFYVVARDLESDGSEYSWMQVTPRIGTAQTRLSFRDDEVHLARRAIILWSAGDVEEEGAMSPDEIHDLYLAIGDPSLQPRAEAVRGFYADRHASRTRTGRALAAAFRLDRPPKYL